jgi:circadian clock protein KaiB
MSQPSHALTLFITGATPRSMRAIANVRSFCDRELAGAYELEIVDLYQHPDRAQPANVVVAPTLVRYQPKPVKMLIGDMSDQHHLSITVKVT